MDRIEIATLGLKEKKALSRITFQHPVHLSTNTMVFLCSQIKICLDFIMNLTVDTFNLHCAYFYLMMSKVFAFFFLEGGVFKS